ncbi:MAG: ThiF family adenylyltransferase [Desulfovibrionaceae bacterium]|nr:ThiF family adenylyltransferase [Desulfovibrionaceae bacterium]
MLLQEQIQAQAQQGHISDAALASLAAQAQCTLRQAQHAACLCGVLPMRYARNAGYFSCAEQAQLLASHVLLVGLGGLGGTVLEQLARAGVGFITGIDGDSFEESNCNRQLLACTASLGHNKACTAAERVQHINPACEFMAVPHFCHTADDFAAYMGKANLVVDALGGLKHRLMLHNATAQAGLPMVSAGIAGFTGWCAVLLPQQAGVLKLLGADKADRSVEETLGNLAPTAVVAAGLQAAAVLHLLTKRPVPHTTCFFDLADGSFTQVDLTEKP